jgi:hypothetical protein
MDVAKHLTKISGTLIFLALISYFTYLIQAIIVERVLYADGANWFVLLLSQDYFWAYADDPKHMRLFTNLVNQLPVSLAIEFGVTNLDHLKVLFGAGAFLTPVVFYLYSFYLSRRANDYRVFFLSIASLVTSVIQSEIFVINQSFTSLSIAWVILHYLLVDPKIRFFDWLVVGCLSFILFMSHESIFFWAGVVLLGAMLLLHSRMENLDPSRKNLIKIIGLVSTLQIAYALYWQLSHPIASQTIAYLSNGSLLSIPDLWKGNTRIGLLVIFSLLVLVLISVLQGKTKQGLAKYSQIALFLLLGTVQILIFYTGVSSLYQTQLTDPFREFSYRFLVTFGSTFWMLVAIIVVLRRIKLEKKIAKLGQMILATGIISASLWQISNNNQWFTFTESTGQVLATSSTIEIEPNMVRMQLDSAEVGDVYKYRWEWTWPVLGLSLQETGQIEKIILPETYLEYVNPPNQLPFISFDGSGTYFFSEKFLTSWYSDR